MDLVGKNDQCVTTCKQTRFGDINSGQSVEYSGSTDLCRILGQREANGALWSAGISDEVFDQTREAELGRTTPRERKRREAEERRSREAEVNEEEEEEEEGEEEKDGAEGEGDEQLENQIEDLED